MSSSFYRTFLSATVLLSAAWLCYLVSGCGKSSINDKRVAIAVEKLFNGGGSLRRPAPTSNDHPPNKYRVYLDFSESVKPYLHPKVPHDAGFRALLTRMRDIASDRVSWFGFGTPFGAGESVQPPPVESSLSKVVDPKSYTRVNNDYSALIKEFLPSEENPTEKLVISDGVNSPVQTPLGSSLGETAAAIKSWIDTRKAFGLYLLTSGYYCPDPAFTYFSETLKLRAPKSSARVAYNTAKRPFVVMAFATSPAALRETEAEIIDQVHSENSWKLSIVPPLLRPAFSIQWIEDKISLNKVAEYRVEALESPVAEYRWANPDRCVVQLRLVVSDQVNEGDLFKLLEEQLRSGRMQIRCEMLALPNGNSSVSAPIEVPVAWDAAKLQQGILAFRVSSPPHIMRRCWHLRIDPAPATPQEAFATEIGGWSTQDDSTPASEDNILNLQSLVTEIAKGRHKAEVTGADFLFLTN